MKARPRNDFHNLASISRPTRTVNRLSAPSQLPPLIPMNGVPACASATDLPHFNDVRCIPEQLL